MRNVSYLWACFGMTLECNLGVFWGTNKLIGNPYHRINWKEMLVVFDKGVFINGVIEGGEIRSSKRWCHLWTAPAIVKFKKFWKSDKRWEPVKFQVCQVFYMCSLCWDILNNICFHVYAQKSLSHPHILTLSHSHTLALSHSHTLTLSHSLSLDMLNNICFHV